MTTTITAGGGDPERLSPGTSKLLYIGIAVCAACAVGTFAFVMLSGTRPTAPTVKMPATVSRVIASDADAPTIDATPASLELADNGGRIAGFVSVTALRRDMTLATIRVNGDNGGFAIDRQCPPILANGARCTITVTYDPARAVGPATNPEVEIAGEYQNGGRAVPVSTRTRLIARPPLTFNAGAVPAGAAATANISEATGAPAADTPPGPATPAAGIAPYGPPAPATPTSAPAPAPVAAPYPYSGYEAGYPPVQNRPPRLSERQAMILARRQPALTGPGIARLADDVRTRSASAEGWTGLAVPSTTSSGPVDTTRILTADRIITAVLVRPIDGATEGRAIAQVDRNVYGGQGRTILIPRGSMIIGQTSGAPSGRAAVTWTQIIRPDGARFVVQASAGDAAGTQGVPGILNERLGKRYGAILLGTAINAGIAIGLGAQETAVAGGFGGTIGRNNGAIVSDIVRADLQRITQDIIRRNGQLQPIVTIPAGTRLTVVPMQDLVLQPMPTPAAAAYPRAGANNMAQRQAGGTTVPDAGSGEPDRALQPGPALPTAAALPTTTVLPSTAAAPPPAATTRGGLDTFTVPDAVPRGAQPPGIAPQP